MKNNLPLVVVISCKKNKEKQTLIKEHFKNNIDYLLVQGGCENTFISDNILYLKVDDSYELLHIKVIEAFKHIARFKKPILKIDDDTFLDINKFKKFDFNFDYGGFVNVGPKTNYVYHQDKITDKRFLTPINDNPNFYYDFALGGGYFLSKKALNIILKNYKKNSEYYNHLQFKKGREDRIVGQILYPFFCRIVVKNNGFWIDEELFSAFDSMLYHPVTEDKYSLLLRKKNINFYV